ncbi:MAG: tyrosine-type recombinase/integrase [Emcibacteraceae bacterium]|nr:tyrosine-type recombinase/integrase [Emcibacteraceae bacterium]
MTTRKAKITNQTIKNLKPGEIIWDTDLSGFGVRCQVKAIVYILKKRIKGTQRWLTIGKHGEPWNPDKARTKAKVLLGQIADNKDPAKERDDLKTRPTIKDLCEKFMDEYAREHKKQSSVNLDQMNIDNHILPLLGEKTIEDVSKSDIEAFMRAVKAGKTARGLLNGKTIGSPVKGGEGAANRCLALLSTVFNFASECEWRSDNPAKKVKKYKERKIERYLSATEFDALAEVIRQKAVENSNPYPIAAIKLLIFTGARRNEILTLKWDQVDLNLGVISLTDSKTGPKPIFLNAPAKEVLETLPKQKGNAYVICGAITGAHLVNLRKVWCRIRDSATLELWQKDPLIVNIMINYKKKNNKLPTLKLVKELAAKKGIELGTGLQDVRLHDLRHTFASIAVGGGMSLPMISKLLGHTQTATTERYAHLADNPLKEANDAIGKRIETFMRPKNREQK